MTNVPETGVPETSVPDAPAKNQASEPQSEKRGELRPELRRELRNWCEAWKICLQNVLSQVSGTASGKSAVFEISSQPLPAADSDVWYMVVAGGAVHGEMTLRLPAASGTSLAQKFLGEAEPAVEGITVENITPENKQALEELLRQIAGLAATALASNAGGEVQLHLSASTAASWSTSAQPSPPSSTSPSSSYGRLMDVGLDVKLRFGTRRMLLRDVLALSAGVVVELDNALHSPVDLLLDGRLIAQGEVVVVDGKYGLRITDVVDLVPAAGSPV